MSNIVKIKNVLSNTTEWICIFLVAILTILSVVSVFLRYILNVVFVQTEELITFLFVVTCFLGSVSVMNKGEHVSVSLIQSKVSPKFQKIIMCFQFFLIIAINGILIYASIKWIHTNIGYTTPGMKIPYWTVYVFLPISCGLSGIVAFLKLIIMLKTSYTSENTIEV